MANAVRPTDPPAGGSVAAEARPGERERAPAVRPRVHRRGFFEVYKRGQGFYTRLGTALGGGLIILGGVKYLYDQLAVVYDPSRPWTMYVRYGLPLAFLAAGGLLLYWIVCVWRKSCDFFIATEGEMKKVSWTTWGELVGATKVVIAATLLLAVILFVIDVIFMLFFAWIGVLKVQPAALKAILSF